MDSISSKGVAAVAAAQSPEEWLYERPDSHRFIVKKSTNYSIM
jgi:hypothetical protein